MAISCFNWQGNPVTLSELQRLYNFKIHPAPAGRTAFRIVRLEERFGLNQMEANFPSGVPCRMIIPGEDRNHSTQNGRFSVEAQTQRASYFPASGQSGPYGFKAAGPDDGSDYIDGLGLAFDQYRGFSAWPPPDGVNFDNRYGHVVPTFEEVRVSQPGPAPIPGPLPFPVDPREVWYRISGAEFERLRRTITDLDNQLQGLVNRPPSA